MEKQIGNLAGATVSKLSGATGTFNKDMFYVSSIKGTGAHVYMRHDGEWFYGMNRSSLPSTEAGGTYFQSHEEAEACLKRVRGMKAGDAAEKPRLWVVWNSDRTEGVIFDNRGDAALTAEGHDAIERRLSEGAAIPALGAAFADLHEGPFCYTAYRPAPLTPTPKVDPERRNRLAEQAMVGLLSGRENGIPLRISHEKLVSLSYKLADLMIAEGEK